MELQGLLLAVQKLHAEVATPKSHEDEDCSSQLLPQVAHWGEPGWLNLWGHFTVTHGHHIQVALLCFSQG
eukprot:5272374-Lingulodinium_polyedra.AAC.1